MKIRRIVDHDLSHLFRARNDPSTIQWTRQNIPLHWDDHLSWFKRQRTDHTIEMFAMEEKGKCVSVFGLTSIDQTNRRAEFSLYVLPESRCMGYGEISLTALFNIGFKDLNLNMIWGETIGDNPAQELFKKMGMIYEGSRRNFYFKNGKYVDANLYSILESEWTG